MEMLFLLHQKVISVCIVMCVKFNDCLAIVNLYLHGYCPAVLKVGSVIP